MIIVCGADNTGKTTLVNHLKEKFGLTQVPRYHTMPPTDVDDWLDWMKDAMTDPGEHWLIADRMFVEELVYGPIIRGGVLFRNNLEVARIIGELERTKSLIILCDIPESDWMKNFSDRGQYPNISQNQKVVVGFLNTLGGQPFSRVKKCICDYTDDPRYETVDGVVKKYLEEVKPNERE